MLLMMKVIDLPSRRQGMAPKTSTVGVDFRYGNVSRFRTGKMQ